MKYNILKETNPKNTVKTIKNILQKINLKIDEEIVIHKRRSKYIPYSLKVFMRDNKQLSANGKGSNLNNAEASAYAEFMERLQAQFLLTLDNDKNLYAPDEEIVEFDCLKNNELSNFVKSIDLLKAINTLVNSNLDYDFEEKENKVILVPFYSFKKNTIVKLPVNIISFIQGSTGLAAGNTIEEALVQGLSEICERFVQTKVINENISMPNIPSEQFNKYEKIHGMIKLFRKNGYIVSIKDASLGMNFPVVCTVIYSKKNDTISIKFGSHPSLPVAIERCLTEFAQGQDITAENINIPFETFISKYGLMQTIYEKRLNFLNEKIQICNVFMENCDYLQEQFYRRKPLYDFSTKNWIQTDNNIDNKGLLKFLIKSINKHTDEIYVRDISFLGFPSVIITIPHMNFFIDDQLEKIENKIKLQHWIKNGMNDSELSIEEFFMAIWTQGPPIFFREYNTSSKFPNEYLLLLCSIILNDYKNIIKYSECILFNKKSYEIYKQDFISNIILINKFYNMKQQDIQEEEIFNVLRKTYNQDYIKKFKAFIKYLSFDVIKNIIKYNNKITNEANSNEEKLNIIKKKLIEQMYENVIRQENFSKVFYS